MKWCKHCQQNKAKTAFKEREDAWGLYDWCEKCRHLEGRQKVTYRQARYMKKTQIFFVGV